MKIRLIDPPLSVPRYRQIRLPTVAAEFSPYAEVEINDENIEAIDYSPADLVGITAQAYNAKRAFYLADKFRSRGIKTIMGGPYATGMPGHALEHFDAVVVGEVEGLGERIVGDFGKGRLGGVYKLETPPEDWGKNLPRRDLQKADKYYWFNYPIEFTRGCPHRCRFCFGPYAYPSFRTRSLDSIAAQLAQWDHGLIESVDMNFAADRNHIMEVCRLMEELKVAAWAGEATLLSMDDDEVLKSLEKSNCVQVFVGLESIEKDTLKTVNKGFNKVEDYRRVIRKIQDHGIFVHAGFIWGLDGQTTDTFEATARFCEETKIYLVSANLATYYPGTRAYEELDNDGRILTKNIREYDSAHLIAEPDKMSIGEVYEGFTRFYKKFYSLKSIFFRSFQSANSRYSLLADFWGFNLAYRAYTWYWMRRLGKTDTPWKAPGGEEETFPHMGGKMPLTFRVGNWEWKFFHRWYMAWSRPPESACGFATASMIFLAALASLLGFYHLRELGKTHWPVHWPPVAPTLCCFVVFTCLAAWLVTRLARVGTGGQRTSVRGRYVSCPLLLPTIAPMALCVLALPPYAGGWIFITSFSTALFFLKSWSVLLSKNHSQKNPLRVSSFILFFPTLDFDGAFCIDKTKRNLTRHYPLISKGLFKLALGISLVPALFYLVIHGFDSMALGTAGSLFRLVILYLLLCGLLEYLTGYWRMLGYEVPDPFAPRIFAPAAPSSFFRGFNTFAYFWLHKHVYLPSGGKKRPVLGAACTFLASGVLAAITLAPVAGRFPFEVLLFFAANGAPLLLEKIFFKNKKISPLWSYLLYLLAVLAFFSTARLLFSITDRVFI